MVRGNGGGGGGKERCSPCVFGDGGELEFQQKLVSSPVTPANDLSAWLCLDPGLSSSLLWLLRIKEGGTGQPHHPSLSPAQGPSR